MPKLSSYPNAALPLDGTETIPLIAGGANVNATVQDVLNLIPPTTINPYEIAFGDSMTGAIVSNNLFQVDPLTGNVKMAGFYFNSNGAYPYMSVGEPFPDLTNYTLLRAAGTTSINGTSTTPINFKKSNTTLVSINEPGINIPLIDMNNVVSNNALRFYDKYSIGLGSGKLLLNTNAGGGVQIGDYDGINPTQRFLFDNATGCFHVIGKSTSAGNGAIVINSTALGDMVIIEDYLPRMQIGAGYSSNPSTLNLGNNAGSQNHIGFGNDGNLGRFYSPLNDGMRVELNNVTDGDIGVWLSSDPSLLSYNNSRVSAGFKYNVQIGKSIDVSNDLFARMMVNGATNDSSYYSAKFRDSLNTDLMKVRNDGYVIQRAVNSSFLDADLNVGEMVSFINELTDELVIKVKYSGGTVKKTTLSLV